MGGGKSSRHPATPTLATPNRSGFDVRVFESEVSLRAGEAVPSCVGERGVAAARVRQGHDRGLEEPDSEHVVGGAYGAGGIGYDQHWRDGGVVGVGVKERR